jgi:hypothetical protein
VLGLVCAGIGPDAPKWLSIRNISVPRISGESHDPERARAAALLYQRYSFWTSVQSAIATWAVIAGKP